MKNLQKAAMFGLDARVALAIFSALSVITGVVLYKALQETKIVEIITELNNIDKAMTAYFLDTGTYPAIVTFDRLRGEDLFSSAKSGWKGPYIAYHDNGNMLDGYIVTPNNVNVRIYGSKDTDWQYPGTNTSKCVSGADSCSVYVCFSSGYGADMQKAIDLRIDEIDAPEKGNFRYFPNTYSCKKGMTYDKSLAPVS
ncbi:MAG: hypothetical protein GY793_02175 [Proteobacteria bacterium]|nr:hypothetical protein [Pseudomonadota bacterium]